jgi:hypothetical protein
VGVSSTTIKYFKPNPQGKTYSWGFLFLKKDAKMFNQDSQTAYDNSKKIVEGLGSNLNTKEPAIYLVLLAIWWMLVAIYKKGD